MDPENNNLLNGFRQNIRSRKTRPQNHWQDSVDRAFERGEKFDLRTKHLLAFNKLESGLMHDISVAAPDVDAQYVITQNLIKKPEGRAKSISPAAKHILDREQSIPTLEENWTTASIIKTNRKGDSNYYNALMHGAAKILKDKLAGKLLKAGIQDSQKSAEKIAEAVIDATLIGMRKHSGGSHVVISSGPVIMPIINYAINSKCRKIDKSALILAQLDKVAECAVKNICSKSINLGDDIVKKILENENLFNETLKALSPAPGAPPRVWPDMREIATATISR